MRELAEVGIECEPIRVDDYTGKKMTFFHDPDGLPLELQAADRYGKHTGLGWLGLLGSGKMRGLRLVSNRRVARYFGKISVAFFLFFNYNKV